MCACKGAPRTSPSIATVADVSDLVLFEDVWRWLWLVHWSMMYIHARKHMQERTESGTSAVLLGIAATHMPATNISYCYLLPVKYMHGHTCHGDAILACAVECAVAGECECVSARLIKRLRKYSIKLYRQSYQAKQVKHLTNFK